ncbi:winged helix-turn-helix transcriptional regulator [Azomonas macrocytogenes]|uniref:DNA-binding HxlR family transcriptional regulator n=1 Tax=Azomonas macrocytogenes TaxID=69962 RepID=A0A839T7E5_AZOMA|nr:helix-turn-helix domain-containing protein [Azomonas macrocytogenes]MBB3105417.1 DNA-binding HxlR family transcriptional regulator [Azomonas macrocytogenes]
MAKKPALESSECPVARTLEAIGDRWSLMIIRDAFDDTRRFTDFRKSLGVAKNILATRLKSLVDLGIFSVQPASDGSIYNEYVLTEMGRSLFPIIITLRQWGEHFMYKPGETHSILLDKESEIQIENIVVKSSTGKVLNPEDCHRKRIVKL